MSKLISAILAVLLLASMLSGCGNQNGSEQPAQTTSPTATGEVAGTDVPNGLQGELSSIIDEIYANKDAGIAVETKAVDVGDADSIKYFTGLSDADKIEEAFVSEAMMSSQAYSLVLVRLKDGADAQDVAQAMKDGIDTRKWICVEADDLRVAACGDVVMLIMVSSALSDTVTAAQIVDAFSAVCGGTLTVDLK